jgi:hypothetical protein
MGLTVFSFILVPFLLVNVVFALRRSGGKADGLSFAFLNLLLAGFALCKGVAFATAGISNNPTPLALERLSAAFLFAAHASLLIVVLEFPSQAPKLLRAVGVPLILLAAAYVAYRIGFTYDYALRFQRVGPDLQRIKGDYYRLFGDVQAAMGLVASGVLAARALSTASRIQGQRSALAMAGTLSSTLLIWLFTVALSQRSAVRASYTLAPLAALLLGTLATYAFSISRLFDWRAIGRTVLAYGILLLVVGGPLGLAVAALTYAQTFSVLIPAIGTPLAFVLAFLAARRFSARFLERIAGRGEYREELESALAHVDLAKGRDAVLSELHELLSKSLDFADFSVLIENDGGVLRTVYSPSGAKAALERGTPLAAALEDSGATVVLKSEAVASPSFAEVRKELLALYESLLAEALILVREGRRVIGAFAFGARRTGADYTDYDYDTFKAIYGKLFVFAYYLKNVARESLLNTVDRELALSDQIIRFATEKVDRLEHDKVDSSWTMRSTRSLGGDFVDFVRLSQDRWFFVLGDVSGKGLSASMNMLILKSMVRTFLRVEKDFVGLVARVNTFIKDNLPRGTFFAGVFGYFDLSKDAFYFLNCGVPTMLLYSPSFDTFIDVQGEGRILGFVRDVAPFLKPRKLLLPPGSALVVATDGVSDAQNLRGERFGQERLRRAVRERLPATAAEIAEGVVAELLAFSDNKQEDDITLLVMKFAQRSAQ